jgi:hypothetical protein
MFLATNGADQVQLATNNLPRLTVDGAGNVGIGITNPGAALHVFNNIQGIRVDGTGAINASNFQGLGFQYFNTSGEGAIQASGSVQGFLTFFTTTGSMSERMRIEPAGNVGIGITSTATKLHVNGAVQVGNDGNACNASTNTKYGAIRWTGNNLQICNSNGWTDIQYSGGSPSLPAQCFTYTVINDATRNTTFPGGVACDSGLANTWYRFTASGNSTIPNSVTPLNQCGTQATGWYSATSSLTGSPGVIPGVGQTINAFVCYHWAPNNCNWNNSVSVTNCDGYFVYFLLGNPVCNLRYCTTGP